MGDDNLESKLVLIRRENKEENKRVKPNIVYINRQIGERKHYTRGNATNVVSIESLQDPEAYELDLSKKYIHYLTIFETAVESMQTDPQWARDMLETCLELCNEICNSSNPILKERAEYAREVTRKYIDQV